MDFRIAVGAILITAAVAGFTLAENHAPSPTVLACGDTPGFCPNPPSTTTVTKNRDGSWSAANSANY